MPAKAIPTARSSFPKPRFVKVQDRGAKQNCVKFFEYWREIGGTPDKPNARAELIEVRIYRHWPVVNLKLAEPTRRDTVWELITGACPFDPTKYIQGFLERFNSGEWHVCLNETGVHGPIMECYFSAIDLDRYPPKVDLRTVLPSVEKNRDYLRFLSMNNIKTPWDNPQSGEEGNDEMASSDALKVVADALVRTSEATVNATNEAAEAKIEAAEMRTAASERRGPSAHDQAESAAIGMVVSTTDKLLDRITAHAGQQYDPLQMMEGAVKLMQQTSNSDGTVRLIIDVMKESSERQIKTLEMQFEFLKTTFEASQRNIAVAPQSAGVVQSPVDPFAAMASNVESITRIATALGFSRPGGGGAAPAENPYQPPPEPSKGMGQLIVENIVPILSIVALAANILYNMKAAPGTGQNPEEALKKATSDPMLAGLAAQAAGGMPGAAPPAAAHPAAQPSGDPLAAWQTFILQLQKPFIAHFFGQDYSGYTLAEFVMSNGSGGPTNDVGRENYIAVRDQLGRAGLDKLIRENFEIWSKVQGSPQRYDQFLSEFFGYDEWARQSAETAA